MNNQLQTPPDLQQFESSLHLAGLRITQTRRSLFVVLYKAHKPLTIQHLVAAIPDSHFVSIYRSIHLLTRAGCLKQVPMGFQNAYELSDTFKPHHHHATCEKCGKTTEIRDAKIEQLMKQVAQSAGFTIHKHHFELFGICSECQDT